jgi:hypothetical protein
MHLDTVVSDHLYDICPSSFLMRPTGRCNATARPFSSLRIQEVRCEPRCFTGVAMVLLHRIMQAYG